MEKPREFWIVPVNGEGSVGGSYINTLTVANRYVKSDDELIHVIEKSAYDELVKKLEKTKRHVGHEIKRREDHDSVNDQTIDRLIQERDELVRALERIASGTTDIEPPFRYAPNNDLRKIAREALALVSTSGSEETK